MDNLVDPSRRQRLMDVVKNTKTTYLPSLVKTIGNFTAYPTSSACEPLPEDTQICIYNAFSVPSGDGYLTEVTAWVYAPGTMTRKNRVLLSLMNKFTKSDVGPATEAMLENQILEEADAPSLRRTGTSSSQSTASTTASTASLGSEILKARLSATFARQISSTQVRIVLGSESAIKEDLVEEVLISDAKGMIETKVKTPYKPSVVQLCCVELDTTAAFKDIMHISKKGISVITDIDDTVRITGVVGPKAEMLRNVFVKDYVDCAIPGVAQWFTKLADLGCGIHYVSNSPWQVYNVVCDFMAAVGLPHGTIHLRQYNGNMISSLLQPPHERKRVRLEKIVNDFPDRRFILVGDSGESDLEAYHGLALLYPEKIKAIYIRVIHGSFSSYDELKVLEDLHNMIDEREHRLSPEPVMIDDLIDLDKKVAPPPPSKPQFLRGTPVLQKPELPRRMPSPTMAPSVPALPPRRNFQQTEYENMMSEEELNDKKGEEWRERVRYLVDTLPAHIHFKLWTDVSDVLEDSLQIVE
ncbi:unnamed protein product [Kuraishia capsulata CBS 1993]|uniref:Phosphatidate phosphatase APP1 catalytic domain-containing protein n=1 Tax=Kuraishia capsulata CBS 1993 TaxID=1382522 RepID=W6MVA4_9ASCO|nr:uncharacterized protein KUCA_T00002141001 [Kuraishia capsulata CBS 1993]CDK26170.1 unnamed protein product [Kuraishia capsulata CBS 1993]